jgi:hypothetical protein
MEQQKWHQVASVELTCQHFNFRCQLELSVRVVNPHECNLVVLYLGLWFLVKSLLPPAASVLHSDYEFWNWFETGSIQGAMCEQEQHLPAGIPVSVPFQSLWPTEDIKNWVKSNESQYLRFISIVAAGGGDDFHRHIHSCVLSEPQCTNAMLCLKEFT